MLAGDFNQLQDRDVIECTGFTELVHQPTRGANILDRIYVSDEQYSSVRVIQSVVRSDTKQSWHTLNTNLRVVRRLSGRPTAESLQLSMLLSCITFSPLRLHCHYNKLNTQMFKLNSTNSMTFLVVVKCFLSGTEYYSYIT